MKASYKEREIIIGNQVVPLKPGQFIFGRKSSSKELHMSQSKTWRMMNILKNLQNIDIKSNNKFSIIIIINWDTYQSNNPNNGQQDGQQMDNKWTTDGHKQESQEGIKKEKKRYVTDMTGLIKLYGKEKATAYLKKVDTFAKTQDVTNKFALADSWIQKDIKPTPHQDDDDPFARIPKCDTCEEGYMKNKPTCWTCLGLERKRRKENG